MKPATAKEIEAALQSAVPHDEHLARRAMMDVVNRFVPESPAWTVQSDDDWVTVYALVDRSIHAVRGKREPILARDPPTRTVRSQCGYRLIPLSPDATFRCDVEETVSRENGAVVEIVEKWTFTFQSGSSIAITGKLQDDNLQGDHAHVFARALAEAMSRAQAR